MNKTSEEKRLEGGWGREKGEGKKILLRTGGEWDQRSDGCLLSPDTALAVQREQQNPLPVVTHSEMASLCLGWPLKGREEVSDWVQGKKGFSGSS